MKTDVITIDHQGNGFHDAVDAAVKAAEYRRLGSQETTQLQLLANEMVSLLCSVRRDMQAEFWVESDGMNFELHMTTKTFLNKNERYQLLSMASSQKNEITNRFLGKLVDALEQAMAADAANDYSAVEESFPEYLNYHPDDPEWDGYERSVLKQYADHIKIFIHGNKAEMTVQKDFSNKQEC